MQVGCRRGKGFLQNCVLVSSLRACLQPGAHEIQNTKKVLEKNGASSIFRQPVTLSSLSLSLSLSFPIEIAATRDGLAGII